LPAARARELFKPSTDSASPLVDIEKKIFVFGLAFAGLSKQSMTSTSRGSSKIKPNHWRETARDLNAF